MTQNIWSTFQGLKRPSDYFKPADLFKQNYGNLSRDSGQQGIQSVNSIRTCLSAAQNSTPKSEEDFTKAQVITNYSKLDLKSLSAKPPTGVLQIKSDPIPHRTGLSALFMFLLSYCLPISGFFDEENSSSELCKPILLCLPNSSTLKKSGTEIKNDDDQYKPIGLVTRNKDADFIGGKFISKCTCGRRDGLGGSDCPRLSCRNNPGCTMNPPRCWPQIKLPPPPPPPIPNQNMICLPIEVVYYDPPQSDDS